MIIKFQDKFESIFYAVLYTNLTGYYLSSKNEADNLFKNETLVNIDNLNWQEILLQHNNKFGQIKWLDNENQDFLMFKKNIEAILELENFNKYKIIINIIKQAIKYGLAYVNQYNFKSRQSKIKISRNVFRKSRMQKVIIFEAI